MKNPENLLSILNQNKDLSFSTTCLQNVYVPMVGQAPFMGRMVLGRNLLVPISHGGYSMSIEVPDELLVVDGLNVEPDVVEAPLEVVVEDEVELINDGMAVSNELTMSIIEGFRESSSNDTTDILSWLDRCNIPYSNRIKNNKNKLLTKLEAHIKDGN